MRDLSPLRYPGGKARLAPYLARLAAAQYPRVSSYAEPFAGGAGAALRLLVDEVVRRIYINDLNPGVAAMWRGVFDENERFVDRLLTQAADLPSWDRAREIYLAQVHEDPFELGFATFLLNRWNRSGIITARPIGGLDQDGPYKIDARFNRPALAERVTLLGEYRNRVEVTELDGALFLGQLTRDDPQALVYVDPPYLIHGDSLYLNSLNSSDHTRLSSMLIESDLRWLLTYDADARVPDELYAGLRCAEFNIAHTAQVQQVGQEYVVFSADLRVPDINLLPRADAAWLGPAAPPAPAAM